MANAVANVWDVAAYILEQQAPKERGSITTWKLQKLAYYSQAWSLVWDDEPLFDQRIEAWANGPVCPALYNFHRGFFTISPQELPVGNPENLTGRQKRVIDLILGFYGPQSSDYLSKLTHSEKPWLDARKGVADGQPSSNVISHRDMAEYYSSQFEKAQR
jgi:uncharacterized phage-associated protein